MSAFGDGGAGRDERDLAKPCGAFIGINQLLQKGFIVFRVHFDDAPVFEGYAEIFDQAAAIAQGEGCGDRAISAIAIR